MAFTKHWGRGQQVAVTVSLILGTVWTSACVNLWGEPHGAEDQMSGERVECPRYWGNFPIIGDTVGLAELPPGIHVVGGRLEYHPPAGTIAPSGLLTNSPEVNDCQRFVSKNQIGFDSLYAIFASFRLDSVVQALAWEGVNWSSANSAVATVDPAGRIVGVRAGATQITATSLVDQSRKGSVMVKVTPALTPTTMVSVPRPSPDMMATIGVGQQIQAVSLLGKPTGSSLAAAAIYSFGPGYPALGIGPNFNCLYLYFDTTAALVAKVVHVDSLAGIPTACLDAVNPQDQPGTLLTVFKSPSSLTKTAPVARWDQDRVSKGYYIGIKCKDAWCELGKPNETLTTSTAYLDGVSAATGDDVVRFKGWYDEQNLAWRPPGSSSLKPSGIVGTVIPAANLASLGRSDFHTFVPVAYIALDTSAAAPGAVAYLKQHLNVNPISVISPTLPRWDPTRLNKLELCYGSRSECEVKWTSEPPGVQCADKFFGFPISRWWVRITPAGETVPRFRCVKRYDHTDYPEPIAGTTRWRWILGDETVWTECVQGCCQTQS